MPVLRNRFSNLRAGGPRQFTELRDRIILTARSADERAQVIRELSQTGFATIQLDTADVIIAEPENRIEDVLDRFGQVRERTENLDSVIEQIRQAREEGETFFETTAATLEATDEMLNQISQIAGVATSDFIFTYADYGPENLRFAPNEMENVSTDEAQNRENNLSDINQQKNLPEAWEMTRGEGVVIAIFDTGYARNLISEDRIIETFSHESVDSVYASGEGHGTMTAGAAAASSEMEGVPFNGAAPDSDVILVRITDNEGQIRGDVISQAWDWIDGLNLNQPIVTNHSYGTPVCSGRPRTNFCNDPLARVIEVVNRREDITSMYAAGNEAMTCFPEGTNITTTKGQKNIEDIKIDDHVITHTGKISRVTDTMCRRWNNEMIKIRPYYGEEIVCTPDHPILIRDKSSIFTNENKVEWKEAKDIAGDDELVIPRIQYDDRVPDKMDVPDYRYDGQMKKYKKVMELRENTGAGPKELHDRTGVPTGTINTWIYQDIKPRELLELPDKIEIDEDIARLIGYFVAEGYTDKTRIGFGIHEDEEKIENDIREIIHNKFNENINVKRRENEGKSVSIEVNNYPISELFESICGSSAENKHFPNWAPFYKTHIIKELIKGYYKGDGWNKDPSRHSISTQSEELAYQFKFMMSRLGAVVGMSRSEGGDKSEIYGREVERNNDRLRVYSSKGDQSIQTMQDVTDVVATDGSTRTYSTKGDISDEYVFVEVDEIKQTQGTEYVYNIEVEDDHSYVANGLAVHNCGHRLLGFTNAITGHNSLESVITSGALLSSGREAQRYSSHGRGDCAPIADPKPNISNRIPQFTYYGVSDGWTIKDMSTGAFGSSGGTSHAAPHASGMIALMQSRALDVRDGPLSTEEIKQIIQDTAERPHVNQVNAFGLTSPDGYDARFGHGEIQIVDALNQI